MKGGPTVAKRDKPIQIHVSVAEHLRHALGRDKTEAMRDGVIQRAHTFRAKKGKGSYRRKEKYPD
jgi:stalled ribosome alternative rescue factor ArfA